LHSGYDGIRGNALAGATGSGLGWSYGMALILYAKIYLIKKNKISLYIVAIALFLFLGIFFSARTGFLGCVLAVVYFIFSQQTFYSKLKKIILFTIFLVFFSGTLYIIFKNRVLLLMEKVLPYVFELFYNKVAIGRFETVSTNVLFEMWEKSNLVTSDNFLLGDGWFTDPVTGKYYHRVDIGYLRNMFYWGIVGTLVNYICQIYIFKSILFSGNVEEKRFVFYILLCLFIIELKANVVGFGHITMIFCTFYILVYNKFKLKELTG
jgi:hypothetical protein